jgi:TolA-binding protein
MYIAPSSRRARRESSRLRMRLVIASCTLAMIATIEMMSTLALADPIRMVHFSEENLPAQDMPSNVASPEAGPTADWVEVPPSAPGTPPAAASASAPPNPSAPLQSASSAAGSPSALGSPAAADSSAALAEPTPLPTPADIAPLEVGSVAPQLQISDSSLDGLIQNVHTTQPALAASLRVTDQARDQLMNNHADDAVQTLMRAMSIDAGNPYAYFYLGRAYLAKKNYDQALTFFSRAENNLGNNPQWLGETLAFEGLANEQAGQNPAAIACYQKALVAVPGNLMARVGLTRLAPAQPAPAVEPVSAPAPPDAGPEDASDDEAPAEDAAPPPPASQPPPAAN